MLNCTTAKFQYEVRSAYYWYSVMDTSSTCFLADREDKHEITSNNPVMLLTIVLRLLFVNEIELKKVVVIFREVVNETMVDYLHLWSRRCGQ